MNQPNQPNYIEYCKLRNGDKMKKITENALLYRVNQLREKMAFYEAVGDGSQTPVGGLPSQTPNRQTPGNPGYNVKPAPAEKAPAAPAGSDAVTPQFQSQAPVAQGQTTPSNLSTQVAAAVPNTSPAHQQVQQQQQQADQTARDSKQPEGHFYDPAVNFAKRVGDNLSYAVDHASELGQGVGQTAANMAKTVGNAAGVAGNFIGGAVKGAMGGGDTQGQQKVGANQGTQTGGKWPTTDPEIRAFQKANGLKADGMIGANTMAALQKQGVQPPAGFKPVANKQHQAAPAGAAAKSATPGQASQGKVSDPKVVELQKKLIAQGWPLKPDGIMGPNTEQAYQAQFKTDSMNASMQPAATPAAPAAPAAPAGAAAITPAFQSQQAPTPAPTAQQSAYSSSALGQMQRALQQQEAGQSIQTAPPEKPEGVTVFPGTVTQQTAASAAQPSGGWDQNDPDTPAMFRNPLPGEPGMHESVSFKNEDSLARILQLAKW
jgi:hypothetical protein